LKLVIKSTSLNNTLKIAENIGRQLCGGEVIELISDLGGGKTVFAKGLAKGAGSDDLVSSPTFTISKVYNAPKFSIYHFDFYRLDDAGIVAQELAEVIDDNKAVAVIEWAGAVKDVLPKQRLTINIEQMSLNGRQLTFIYPKKLSYLLEHIK